MPRWAGQADPASAAHWTGTDTPGPAARDHGPAAWPDTSRSAAVAAFVRVAVAAAQAEPAQAAHVPGAL